MTCDHRDGGMLAVPQMPTVLGRPLLTTTGVCPDVTELEPPEFVPATTTRRTELTSALVSV